MPTERATLIRFDNRFHELGEQADLPYPVKRALAWWIAADPRLHVSTSLGRLISGSIIESCRRQFTKQAAIFRGETTEVGQSGSECRLLDAASCRYTTQ